MIKTIALLLMSAILLLAQPLLTSSRLLAAQPKKQETKKPVRPDAAAATEIPAGAKEVEPYIYRYTDAQGKTWMYRKGPFGVMKWEEKDAVQPAVQTADPIVVTDLGDSFRFARKSPFGDQVWTRKKAELTEEEKAMIDRDRRKHGGQQIKSGEGKSQPAIRPEEKP